MKTLSPLDTINSCSCCDKTVLKYNVVVVIASAILLVQPFVQLLEKVKSTLFYVALIYSAAMISYFVYTNSVFGYPCLYLTSHTFSSMVVTSSNTSTYRSATFFVATTVNAI